MFMTGGCHDGGIRVPARYPFPRDDGYAAAHM